MQSHARLKLNVSFRVKRRRSNWGEWVLSVAVGGLAGYGAGSWYFPSPLLSWLLAVPAVLVSLYIVRRLHRVAPMLGGSRLATHFLSITLLAAVTPVVLFSAFGFGLPAIALKIYGPSHRIVATVISKDAGSRSCRRKVAFAELSSPFRRRICVSESLYNDLQTGQKVYLFVRQNAFGTSVFSVDQS